MRSIERLREFIRWRDWGFDKLPLFFLIAFYVALAGGNEMADFVPRFFAFVVLITTMALYGFLVNDLGDIELDRRQGKRNAFLKIGIRGGAVIVTGIVVVMVLAALPFLRQIWFVPLMTLWFLAGTFYSLPPLRLKERGWPGLVASFSAQLPLPALIACAAFGYRLGWDVWAFVAYATCKGLSLDVGHQRLDLARDAQTGTDTFAVRQGYEQVTRLYTWTLTLERLLLGGVLLAILPGLSSFRLFEIRVSFGWPPLLLYLWLLALTVLQARGRLLDPYYEGRKDVVNVLHVVFPNFALPFYLLVLMVVQDLVAVWLLAFFLIWVMPSPQRVVWPIRVLLGRTKHQPRGGSEN
jgi:4-hydroxybenzoate polyprenyltransferase